MKKSREWADLLPMTSFKLVFSSQVTLQVMILWFYTANQLDLKDADSCLLQLGRCAVYFAENEIHHPEKL